MSGRLRSVRADARPRAIAGLEGHPLGIQIKLAGINFNNPDLPILPAYGFAEDFNRADASTLGAGWFVVPAATVHGIISNQAWLARYGALGPTTATLKQTCRTA